MKMNEFFKVKLGDLVYGEGFGWVIDEQLILRNPHRCMAPYLREESKNHG